MPGELVDLKCLGLKMLEVGPAQIGESKPWPLVSAVSLRIPAIPAIIASHSPMVLAIAARSRSFQKSLSSLTSTWKPICCMCSKTATTERWAAGSYSNRRAGGYSHTASCRTTTRRRGWPESHVLCHG